MSSSVQTTLQGHSNEEKMVVDLHKRGWGYGRIARTVTWSESKVKKYLTRRGYFNTTRCDMARVEDVGGRFAELYEDSPQTVMDVVDQLSEEFGNVSQEFAMGAYRYVTGRVGAKRTRKPGQNSVEREKFIHEGKLIFDHVHGYEKVEGIDWANFGEKDGENEQAIIHRLVAVAEYGVDAVADSQVHHKNGIPWDNRHENLVVESQRDHINKHWHKDGLLLQIAEATDDELATALANAGYKEAADAVGGGSE